MKKSNKTYHVEEEMSRKCHNYSPGKITKNQQKMGKSKQVHHQQSLAYERKQQITNERKQQLTHQRKQQEIEQLREQQLRAINKKVSHQLSLVQKQQWEQQSEMRSNYSYGGESNPRSSLSIGSSLNTHSNMNHHRPLQEIQTNPYEEIFLNDKRYFEEYLNSTSKYESNGINLNWPYYFFSNHPQ